MGTVRVSEDYYLSAIEQGISDQEKQQREKKYQELEQETAYLERLHGSLSDRRRDMNVLILLGDGCARKSSKLVECRVLKGHDNLPLLPEGTHFSFHPQLNFIFGPNEAGKTTLFRSLYFPWKKVNGALIEESPFVTHYELPEVTTKERFGFATEKLRFSEEKGSDDFLLDLDLTISDPVNPSIKIFDPEIGEIKDKLSRNLLRTEAKRRKEERGENKDKVSDFSRLVKESRRQIILLDEPEAQKAGQWSIESLLLKVPELVKRHQQRDNQLIIVTHNPIFMAAVSHYSGTVHHLRSEGLKSLPLDEFEIPVTHQVAENLRKMFSSLEC